MEVGDVPWIPVIDQPASSGLLRDIYETSRIPPIGRLAEIYRALTLRPELIRAYQALAAAIIDGPKPHLPMPERQLVAAFVAHLNRCGYCETWHGMLARQYMHDEGLYEELISEDSRAQVPPRLRAMVEYAKRLTMEPASVTVHDIQTLRSAGLQEVEILDLNQVIALLNYSNRVALGLGVELEPEVAAESRRNSSRGSIREG